MGTMLEPGGILLGRSPPRWEETRQEAALLLQRSLEPSEGKPCAPGDSRHSTPVLRTSRLKSIEGLTDKGTRPIATGWRKNLPDPVLFLPDNDDAYNDNDDGGVEETGVGVEEGGSEDLSQRSRRSGVEVSAEGSAPWTEKDVRNYTTGGEEKGVEEARFERVYRKLTRNHGKKGVHLRSHHFGSRTSQSDPPQEGRVDGLNTLTTIEPEGFNIVGEKKLEILDMAMDSGATENVIGEDMLMSVETKEGPASRRGVKYEVADGTEIPNLGEKKFTATLEEGSQRNFTVQVCGVNKALMSVKKVVAAGNRVVFDDAGSYVEDKTTGDKMWLREEGGIYYLRMWVPTSGF